jgi:hypothetical protein
MCDAIQRVRFSCRLCQGAHNRKSVCVRWEFHDVSEKGCVYLGFLSVSVKSQAGLGLVLARKTFWVSRRRALFSAAAAAAWAAARLA